MDGKEVTECSSNFCREHSGMQARLEKVEEDTNKQWDVLDKLRNRLPGWATLVISLLTFLLGASLTYASFAVRLSQTAAAAVK